MKGTHRLFCAASAVGLLAVSPLHAASPSAESVRQLVDGDGAVRLVEARGVVEKAASARSVASRATASPSLTVYGGFELASAARVYILVRGNSLGSLGVTQNYLDAPRVRLYNSAGQDLIVDGNNRPGFSGCLSSQASAALVVSYYESVRGQPANGRDTCIAVDAGAGVYTFSVTPSIPGVTTTSVSSSPASGEMLFEVTLGV